MFSDLFDEKLANAIRSQAENQLAFMSILLGKGICTEEEFEAARLRAVSEFEQLCASKRTPADDDRDKARDFIDQILGGGPL
jgi:hypothetical protein